MMYFNKSSLKKMQVLLLHESGLKKEKFSKKNYYTKNDKNSSVM